MLARCSLVGGEESHFERGDLEECLREAVQWIPALVVEFEPDAPKMKEQQQLSRGFVCEHVQKKLRMAFAADTAESRAMRSLLIELARSKHRRIRRADVATVLVLRIVGSTGDRRKVVDLATEIALSQGDATARCLARMVVLERGDESDCARIEPLLSANAPLPDSPKLSIADVALGVAVLPSQEELDRYRFSPEPIENRYDFSHYRFDSDDDRKFAFSR